MEKNSQTLIVGEEKFEGAKSVILREGDVFQLYRDLQGPSFSEEDYKNRNLKYKIFVGVGEKYEAERVSIPTPLLGQEVFIEKDAEGNLISLLNKKSELSKKLNLEHTSSYKKLIETAEEYVNSLKDINESYRKHLKKRVETEGNLNGKREELRMKAKEKRRELIKGKKEELTLKLNEFTSELMSNPHLREDVKSAYEFLIKYSHFLFYNSLIVGSGNVADLKIENPWVSEHQGLIYREEGWHDKELDEILYENIGLCDATIIRYSKKADELEAEIDYEHSHKLIDFSDKREQKTFLFLSQMEQPLRKYEEFKTPSVYICFGLPAAK